MSRIYTALCLVFSLYLASSDELSVQPATSDDKAEQCLMQKRHQVARSDSLEEKPNKLHRESNADSLAETAHAEGKKAAKKAGEGKKLDKANAVDGQKGEKSEKKGKHGKHQGKKSSLLKTKEKNNADGHKKKQARKAKANHKSKAEPVSLAQMSVSGRQTANKSHIVNLHEILPEPVLALGWELFKTEGAIQGAVDNSVPVEVTYAGVKMSLRMNKFDDAVKRVGEEGTWFSYDLDSLSSSQDSSEDMLNMLDLGGNYGVVSIAAMKKHPKNLRIITVEPIPETFFFLKWNLHLNGIPELDGAALDDKHTPGVLALHRGSTDVAGQDLHFCAYPWSSMNSKMCDCPKGEDNCHIVQSTSVGDLAGMFGKEPIAMVKMDCEGCEEKSLPALAEEHISKRVHRLAGELHLPERDLEDIACRWDHGKFMTKCQRSATNSENIECDVPLSCPE
jgi:FkbM family methyltransferase